MASGVKPGDAVEWSSSQGTIKGKVKKKLTSPMDIKGHHVAASPENPEILVVSDKTGAEAAHKEESLKPAGGSASSAPSRKAATKKVAAKKAPVKTSAKRAPARKVTAAAPAGKAAAKKAAAKNTSAKRAPASKSAARKRA